MDKVIDVNNLIFAYEKEEGSENEVLSGISLGVRKGEFLALLGHNGSGKSTLAKHFNAILVPKSGNVTVEGMNTADESLLYKIRQKVGMVFQNPDNQLVATIVEEDVAFAPENLGVPPQEIRERVDYALKAVNMLEFKQHAPHMLSGGQKQRVAIAGVLAMKPDVLIMDEATAMLDPIGRREIMDTVKRLNKEENMTVIMVTHYMEEAAEADRIIVINSGKAIMEGKPKEVFSKVKELRKIGLDVPQTVYLAYLLEKSGIETGGDVLSVQECANAIYAAYKRSGGGGR